VIRKTLSGYACRCRDRTIVLAAPWPCITERRLYVLAHEVGHLHLHFGPNGELSGKPVYLIELEAEQFAHEFLRAHGIPVPHAERQRARNYVAHHLQIAMRNGTHPTSITRKAAAWAGVKITRRLLIRPVAPSKTGGRHEQ
jgi:hypothetical protein